MTTNCWAASPCPTFAAASESCSFGYWIGRPQIRQGYMSEAIYGATCFAFDKLAMHRIEAACLPHNAASQCGAAPRRRARTKGWPANICASTANWPIIWCSPCYARISIRAANCSCFRMASRHAQLAVQGLRWRWCLGSVACVLRMDGGAPLGPSGRPHGSLTA